MDVVPLHPAENMATVKSGIPETDVKLEAGLRIFGRFTLASLLGEGRCSATWLADDPRFRRDVAVKIFRSADMGSVDTERQTWREFLRSLRILNHANIALSMEFFSEGPWIAIANQYVEGKSLAALTFLSGVKLRTSESESILKSVGLALVAAHGKSQVVHGNLNAYNILLTKDDRRPKITDFGFHPPIASDWDEEADQDLKWKMACLSPERLAGAPPSVADDIHAFAVIAFQLFTGANPPRNSLQIFDAEKAAELLKAAPEIWREKLLENFSPDSANHADSMELFLQGVRLFEVPPPTNPEATKAHYRGSSKRRHTRRSHVSSLRQRKRNRLTRLLIVLCAIAMPLILGLTIYQNMVTSRALEIERAKAEPQEKAAERAMRAKMAELDAALVSGSDRSHWNSRQQREHAGQPEPKPTPKPTPFVVNSVVKSLLKDGQTKMAAGDAAGALETYGMAMILQSDWPDLLEARAAAMVADDQAETAVDEYTKILSVNPPRTSALLGRAGALLSLDRKDEAKADLEAVLKAQPENAEARAQLDKMALPAPSIPDPLPSPAPPPPIPQVPTP